MNLKKLIFVSAIALSSSLVSAQDISRGFTRIYGGAAFMNMQDADSDETDKGFQIGVARYFNLAGGNLPVYLQLGAEYNYLTYSDTEDGIEGKETVANIAIPVNLVYRFGFEHNAFMEFSAGPNFRINTTGKLKVSNSYDSATLDFFDDFEARRFQFGLNAGVALTFSRVSLAYRFNPDLMDYVDKDKLEEKYDQDMGEVKTKSTYHFITLGFTF